MAPADVYSADRRPPHSNSYARAHSSNGTPRNVAISNAPWNACKTAIDVVDVDP